ncbi:hypothetical protein JHK82_031623 [Glycine max]|nr:hypothetical protein JHK82_031623 [Glycine max]
MIKPILPPYEVDDMKIWSGNKLGEFEVASAYQRLDKLEVQSSPKDSYFYMGELSHAATIVEAIPCHSDMALWQKLSHASGGAIPIYVHVCTFPLVQGSTYWHHVSFPLGRVSGTGYSSGAIFRNHTGASLGCFSAYIGFQSLLYVELFAVILAIQYALERN